MCQAVVCEICKKWTWRGELIFDIHLLFISERNIVGCGQHKEAVLQNIAVENSCTCKLAKQKAKKRQPQSQYLTGPSYRLYR